MEVLRDVNETGSYASISSPITFSPVETQAGITGICFGPNCVEWCFTHNIFCTAEEKKCNHQWTTIDINRTGEYVIFPSSFFHRGYFESGSTKVVVTAQLFASSNGSSPNQPGRYLSSSNYSLWCVDIWYYFPLKWRPNRLGFQLPRCHISTLQILWWFED